MCFFNTAVVWSGLKKTCYCRCRPFALFVDRPSVPQPLVLPPPPPPLPPASLFQLPNGKKKTPAAPKLKASAPLKVALLVEPTPFTHISGYSNRFREMLK